MDDAPRFVKWFNDPGFNRFMLLRKVSLKEEREWIKNLSKKKKTDLVFAIETKDKIHIGSIGLHQINHQSHNATLGIMIGNKLFWNRGYGTDAAKIMIDFGFKKLKLHRIGLNVYEYNLRAIKVYKRLGFVKEGVKREHTLWKGKYWGTYHMSILDREWKEKN